jgi:hypothetical protein
LARRAEKNLQRPKDTFSELQQTTKKAKVAIVRKVKGKRQQKKCRNLIINTTKPQNWSSKVIVEAQSGRRGKV